MARVSTVAALLLGLSWAPLYAIEYVPTTSYNKTAPAESDIAGWNSGWAQPAVQPIGYTVTTGWNYVGTINGNSGTYLGYGWVVTAEHVTLGAFNLAGASYPMVPNSAHQIGNADLVVFQVSPAPVLPPLTLRSSDPVANVSQPVMIGYGHLDSTRNESWGLNAVNQINQSISPLNSSWSTNEYLMLASTSSNGTHVSNNNYQIVMGDSGGGEFIYNSSTKAWELAGINDVNGTVNYKDGSTGNFSGSVQLDTYATQIRQIITPVADTPTMPAWAMIALGGVLIHAASLRMGDSPRDS